MLRHAIFVLVLVGAAFAGGAAINGPGLAWLQHNLIGGPTVIVDGSTPSDSGRPPRKFPSANPAPLLINMNPIPTIPRAKPADSPALASAPPAGFPTQSAATPTTPGEMPPLDLPPDPVAPARPPAKADPVARLASAVGDEPATPSASNPGRDWSEVRQRLKTLGVTRYSIDAEMTGRVRFSCVIPVDGLQAVGHHFEAEGDDEFQAIDATLRRVTLWKVNEPTRTDP